MLRIDVAPCGLHRPRPGKNGPCAVAQVLLKSRQAVRQAARISPVLQGFVKKTLPAPGVFFRPR
jgi:hypothetical protein